MFDGFPFEFSGGVLGEEVLVGFTSEFLEEFGRVGELVEGAEHGG